MAERRARLWIVGAALLVGCGPEPRTEGRSPDAGPARGRSEVSDPRAVSTSEEAPREPPEAAGRVRLGPPERGEELSVPMGTLHVGSRPGTPYRRADREADWVPVRIPAFQIDRLPYPNDPTRSPHTQVTRTEAASLCGEEGKRLCHELEWERACRGLDLVSLGDRTAEWTLTDAEPRLARLGATAIVRGGAGPSAARCGFRRATDPETRGPKTGFRCCRGPAPDLTYPVPNHIAPFTEEELDRTEIRRRLEGVPELAAYAADFQPTTALGVARALRTAVAPERAPNGWAVLRSSALRWSPTDGDEVWVVAGVGGGSGLVAALYPGPDHTWVHAASYILGDEPTPVAILYTPDIRETLRFTACYSCAGEDGTVDLKDDGTLVVR